MRRDTLRLSAHQFVETSKDANGRYFIAYSVGASVYVRDPKDLQKFLRISRGLPMREALDSWLASLADTDNSRSKKDVPVTDASTSLSPELVTTGFGPECHGDEEDPTANTRMIT